MNSCPWANSCLKLPKQQAMGSLREIAIEATREAARKLTGDALDATRAASVVEQALRERG